MDKLFELLAAQGGLVRLVTFLVPGFVAWRTYQLRRPQGEQKAADAIIDIIAFSVATALIWFSSDWQQMATYVLRRSIVRHTSFCDAGHHRSRL